MSDVTLRAHAILTVNRMIGVGDFRDVWKALGKVNDEGVGSTNRTEPIPTCRFEILVNLTWILPIAEELH